MQEQESKPKVSPPVSYKAPSLPTLAALGAITAAALATGCNKSVPLGGDPICENEPKIMEEGGVVTLGEMIAPEDWPDDGGGE